MCGGVSRVSRAAPRFLLSWEDRFQRERRDIGGVHRGWDRLLDYKGNKISLIVLKMIRFLK
jgi:hypothetical protein